MQWYKKSKIFFKEQIVKITKLAHALKKFASSYNIETLNSLNIELQLKDTESALKKKLIDLLTQLKDLKFRTTSAVVFRKIENFYSNSKHK